MAILPLAGELASKDQLEREYYELRPDLADPSQLVNSGTSGHRSYRGYHAGHLRLRLGQTTNSPLYMGNDTHAPSGSGQRTALEVLAAKGVEELRSTTRRREATCSGGSAVFRARG